MGKIRVVKRKSEDFKHIVGHVFCVIGETEDKKGYYIQLPVGCCRVEKDEAEVL